jgi:linoleoyl-CoA desaturase
VNLILSKGKYHNHVIPTPKLSEKITLLGFKVIWLGYVIGIPLAVGYTPWQVFLGVAVTFMTYGLVINIVFMLAHVLDSAEFLTNESKQIHIEDEWAIFQLKTTVDFAPKNHFINWYVGGLNIKRFITLFPKVCHIHTPKSQRLCKKFAKNLGWNIRFIKPLAEF